MTTPFLISWRYQKGKQKNRLVSLISLFSTVGIALGVAVLIVGLSAMNGFERELNQRVLSVVPHIEIRAYGNNENGIIQQGPQLENYLEHYPNIEAAAPFITFTALIENGSNLRIAEVRGIEPNQQIHVSQLAQFVPQDQWVEFAEHGGLILGAGIAKALSIEIGDEVTLLLPQPNKDGKLVQPLRFGLTVSGILRLDGQLDHTYALLHLKKAQELLALEANQISGVEMKVAKPFEVRQLNFSELANYPQPLSLQTWIDKFGYMYNDIQLIRTVMYIAMVLVIGVACFNVVSTLVMAVKDKQGDIAIQRTLGANDRFIKQIFLWYGLIAGMKGAIWGVVIGILVSLNLTTIIQQIETLLGVKILSGGIYFIDFLPSEIHWLDLVLVLSATMVLSLAASLYPAARAAKLAPAKVLSGH